MPNRLKSHRFGKPLHCQCNPVERFFNKLKHFRAVATRYDRRDDTYIASVKLASIRIWMRADEARIGIVCGAVIGVRRDLEPLLGRQRPQPVVGA